MNGSSGGVDGADNGVEAVAGAAVTIEYTRLPDRRTVFRQRLVHRTAGCTITLLERTPLPGPVLAGQHVILEPEAPAVWFTFDGAWHDIGRFHTADGCLTGYYANILTPVQYRTPLQWLTTDLCLDVFMHTHGETVLLDEAELETARLRGWLTDAMALRAQQEAGALMAAAQRGDWPPAVVLEWPLARARREVYGTPEA
jgi:predicted RNA-binding protein associated with RNAse of E/G family